MDWYPFYPTAFRRDTYHLCPAAEGLYRRLIDEYMVTGKPLPGSDEALAAIARASVIEWDTHRSVIRAFFVEKNGRLVHKRCESELYAQRMLRASRSAKAKEAASVRWAKAKTKQRDGCAEHAHSNANAMLSDAKLQKKDIISLTSSEVLGEAEKRTTEQKQQAASPYLVEIMQRKRQAG